MQRLHRSQHWTFCACGGSAMTCSNSSFLETPGWSFLGPPLCITSSVFISWPSLSTLPLKKSTDSFENVQNALINLSKSPLFLYFTYIITHNNASGILYKLTMELPPLLEYRKEYLLFEHEIGCSVSLFSFLNGSLIKSTTFIRCQVKWPFSVFVVQNRGS